MDSLAALEGVATSHAAMMKERFSSKVRPMSFLSTGVTTEMVANAVHFDARGKSSIVQSLDAYKARFAFGSSRVSVVCVELLADIAQVAKAIVERVSINMVNNVVWPFTMADGPCGPMRKNLITIDGDKAVSTAHVPRCASIKAPCEDARILIVVKKFAQAFCAKIGFSHDDAPCQIGQGPAGVDALGGPRHCSVGVI
jgi:hypothetical protein